MSETQTIHVLTTAGPKTFSLTSDAAKAYVEHAREVGATVDDAELRHRLDDGGVLKVGVEMTRQDSEDALFVALVTMSPTFWLMVGDAGTKLGYGEEDPQVIDLTAADDLD